MPLQAITAHEPIPGYRVRERLGAGGYGEVWKADAPGELVKAIKFVYGHLNEDRAARELKALSRIKSVRHPFLLSLERIEIVDGQLLIVTELADQSLKDRYDQCRTDGLLGIPRAELLRYLRDTADVLDYMNEQHCLQHLDIKPENLLLLAGRIKVADFGLVKDLHDVTASMMGGLTPLYAPPEVFDGRPSHWSDQYSLAIVYQEMLTGELPFAGSNAMQLARQHLHAQPRLACLPPCDQPIIGQALAKTPEQRFNNCRELTDALAAGDPAAAAARPRSHRSGVSPASRSPRQATAPHMEVHARLPQVVEAPTLSALPPVDPVAPDKVVQPILYVGIGGSGARVVARLHQRWRDAPATATAAPATLLIDTDAKDLGVAIRGAGPRPTDPPELLATPLRSPQSYRTKSSQLLGWLNRRWLYNIPRSLQTDGLRPLGRLAMVDHIDRIRAALQQALQTGKNPAEESTSAPAEPAAGQRIVLVASLAGATGSGMILDIGYVITQLLQECEMPNVALHVVLLYSTGKSARWKELAAVNAYSTLSELYHFTHPNGIYPGDATCNLPPQPAGYSPFDGVELLHLGVELDDVEYDRALSRTAEQLALDSPPAAAQLLDACRASLTGDTPATPSLTTTGSCVLRCLSDDLRSTIVDHVCRAIAEQWANGHEAPIYNWLKPRNPATTSFIDRETQTAPTTQLAPIVARWFEKELFDVRHLLDQVGRYVDIQLQDQRATFFASRLEQILPADATADHEQLAAAYDRWQHLLDELLGCDTNDQTLGPNRAGRLAETVKALCRSTSDQLARSLHYHVDTLVDDPKTRVGGALWAAQHCGAQCEELQSQLQQIATSVKTQLDEANRTVHSLCAEGASNHRHSDHNPHALLAHIADLRLRQFAVTHAVAMVRSVSARMQTVGDDLIATKRQLRELADTFDASPKPIDTDGYTPPEDVLTRLHGTTSRFLAERLAALVDCANNMIDQLDQRDAPSLAHFLADPGAALRRFPDQLRGVANAAILQMTSQLDAVGIIFDDADDSDTLQRVLQRCLDEARPMLADCGGGERLLVILPKTAANTRPLEVLHRDLGFVPSVTTVATSDLILCRRIENIPLSQIGVELVEHRLDYVEYASRVHTRRDIEWSDLPDLS